VNFDEALWAGAGRSCCGCIRRAGAGGKQSQTEKLQDDGSVDGRRSDQPATLELCSRFRRGSRHGRSETELDHTAFCGEVHRSVPCTRPCMYNTPPRLLTLSVKVVTKMGVFFPYLTCHHVLAATNWFYWHCTVVLQQQCD